MRYIFLISILFSFNIYAQSQEGVDFIKLDVEISPILDSREVLGTGTYYFEMNSKKDSIFIDAQDMTFLTVDLDWKPVLHTNSGKRLKFKAPENLGKHQLFLRYIAKPKQTVYFIQRDSLGQVWTQGQGKYTSHWLPSFDDMNEKVEFDLTIVADSTYTVIANGILKQKFPKDSLTAWSFDMFRPMSSYLVAFAIGDFEKKRIHSASGVPIELYYEPKDSSRVEPTYRHSKAIFDFLEKEVGVLYPFQNYKQVPVQDFLYAGMENATCTIFSNSYMIDSIAFVDKNYVNVNAHELAHQWFGNLVTEESGKHHWLHEGFATYYAYLAEEEVFGEDYFYWKLYETAKTLYNLSENGDGEALTNPNANSLTFYEKGAWALVILRERVGDDAFRQGIKSYLERHAYKNATINDFLVEMEKASGETMADFRKEWLESEEFRFEETTTFLNQKCGSLLLWSKLKAVFQENQSDDVDFLKFWNDPESSIQFKEAVIREYWRVLPEALLTSVFDADNTTLRRAIAVAAEDARAFPKEKFEALLSDQSYVTVENALLKLWMAYPENRLDYLQKTADLVGFPNKNIRLLWLTLALVTPEIESGEQKKYYDELNSYTAPQNHFEIRQLAFQYLQEIGALSDISLVNLINATDHHVWQFKKATRNLVRKLATDNKDGFDRIVKSLSDEEQALVNKILAD